MTSQGEAGTRGAALWVEPRGGGRSRASLGRPVTGGCPAHFPPRALIGDNRGVYRGGHMKSPKGMLTLDELRSQVEAGKNGNVVLAFATHYGRFPGERGGRSL